MNCKDARGSEEICNLAHSKQGKLAQQDLFACKDARGSEEIFNLVHSKQGKLAQQDLFACKDARGGEEIFNLVLQNPPTKIPQHQSHFQANAISG